MQEKLGVSFPEDYYQVCRTYGSGYFVLSDQTELRYFNLFDLSQRKAMLLESREMRRKRDQERYALPFPIYPEPLGIIPWGTDSDGSTFFYLPRKGVDPEMWQILAVDRPAILQYIFTNTLTFFLSRAFDGQFETGIWPRLRGNTRFCQR
jgi:hypothetical protein